MKKLKTNLKLVLALAIVTVGMCLFNANTVNAANVTSTDGKVFTKNEILAGLIKVINVREQNIYLEQDTLKTIDLLLNTEKLNSLVKSDNYVYQNIYFKVSDNINKVTMIYENSSTEKEINIVTINNIRYAEIPLAVAVKVDGIYHHNDWGSDGITNLETHSSGTMKLYNNGTLVNTLNASITCEDGQCGAAHAYLTSDTTKKYILGGSGGATFGGAIYDRVLAEEKCYINVDIWDTYIGETLDLAPFGTLKYKGVTVENDIKLYTYQAEIKDKTILNKSKIVCRILLKDYKMLNTSVLLLQGKLIEKENVENIKLNDTATNVIMESNTNIIPKDTVLIVKSENNQIPHYEEIVKLFNKSRNFKIFDISLQSNGTNIQPNGKVKLTIPVPSEFDTSKLCVYRVDENNQKIKYDIEVIEKDGTKYVTFETDHFSIYVLEEEQAKTNTTEESKETKQKQEGEKDDTPKTGTTNNIHFLAPLAVVTILGIVIYCKKQNK